MSSAGRHHMIHPAMDERSGKTPCLAGQTEICHRLTRLSDQQGTPIVDRNRIGGAEWRTLNKGAGGRSKDPLGAAK